VGIAASLPHDLALHFSVVFFLFFACYKMEEKYGCYYRRITYGGCGEHTTLLSLFSLSLSNTLQGTVCQKYR
jgi:hypothetical protein